MNASADCLLCLLTHSYDRLPAAAGSEARLDFLRRAAQVLLSAPSELTTPEVAARLAPLEQQFNIVPADEEARKSRDNALMLGMEDELETRIRAAADPLACALSLCRVGNYLDYGAVAQVRQEVLLRLLRQAEDEPLDAAEYAHFLSDLSGAHAAVYITDNCGEAVLDKLALRVLLERFPHIRWTILVRSQPTLNDLTAKEASEIGLDALAPVLGNGTAYPGTVLPRIAPSARQALAQANLIIAKGQANFETLHGCGLNIYYLLLCKCAYFTRRFGVPALTPMFVSERRVEA